MWRAPERLIQCSTLCPISLRWNLALGTRYQVPDTWYLVLVPGARHLAPGTWYPLPGTNTRYLLPGTWYQVPDTWYHVQVPGTCYMVRGMLNDMFDIYHLQINSCCILNAWPQYNLCMNYHIHVDKQFIQLPLYKRTFRLCLKDDKGT